MTLPVDLFYSFRSPYSYLALPKTAKPAAAPK
jgi:2-hydroxychromene-2-carboxylate isomerase